MYSGRFISGFSVGRGVAALVLALGAAARAHATTHVVCPDGSGDFTTIQAAINASANGDRIELCDATFSGTGNRDVFFNGKAVTVASQSGDPTQCIIDCGGSEIDPHIGFYFVSGEGNASVLQGVTIINGVFDPSRYVAVIISGASPTITECAIVNNGIQFSGNVANAQILDNLFRDFETGFTDTRAIDISGTSTDNKTVTIQGNTFRDFSADYDGTSTACVYVGGTSDAVNTVYIEDNVFENIATLVVSVSGTGDANSTVYFQDNTFTDCDSTDPFASAAIDIGGTGATVIHAQVTGNLIVNCERPAIDIGGISSSQQYGEITSNTIVGNSVGISRGGNVNGLEISRTILWDNGDDLVNVPQAEIDCCDIGDGDYDGINNNFSQDPLFCDPLDGDYRVQKISPCTPGQQSVCGLVGAKEVGCGCKGDLDEDGFVGVTDFLQLLANWGPCP